MNTTENNKIVLEFLGFELTTDGIQTLYYDKNRDLKSVPKFHLDWNWLIPVIQKCKDNSNEEDYLWESVENCLLSFDINLVFESVVVFIENYNDTL